MIPGSPRAHDTDAGDAVMSTWAGLIPDSSVPQDRSGQHPLRPIMLPRRREINPWGRRGV